MQEYFANRYEEVRKSLRTGLLLIIGALGIIVARESVEYAIKYRIVRVQDGNKIDDVFAMPISIAVLLLCITDTIPISFLIYCIRISAKKNWNNFLMAGNLSRPNNEESIECDSQFLLDFRRAHEFNSELFDSKAFLEEVR